MTRPTFYIPDREQIQSLVLRDQEERARALREPTPEPAPVEETGVQVDPRKNRKQGPLLDLMDDVVSRTASVIGDAYHSWGQMSPEEQEEEQSLRRLQARQAEQTNAQLELQRAAENAEIAKALGEPDPTNNTYVGTNVPVQTMGDRNVAFLQEKAQGAPPTLTAARSGSDAFLRAIAEAGLSIAKFPGIAVDSADYVLTGDEKESAYVQELSDWSTAVRKALPGDPTRNGEFVEGMAQGSGFLLAMLTAAATTKGLGFGTAPGATIVGVTSGSVGGYEDAKEHNATATAKYTSFYLNSALGLTDRIPISRALDRAFGTIDKASGGKVTEILVNGTVNSLEELIQELGQGLGQNKIAQILYDNERSIFEGLEDQATVAGVLGFMLGGGSTALSQALNRKPGTPAQPYTPPEPREIPPAVDTPLDPGAFESAQKDLDDATAELDTPDAPPPPAAEPVSQAPADPTQPVSPAPATQDAPLLETPASQPAPQATGPVPTTAEDQATAEVKAAPTPATYAKWIDIYTKPRDTQYNERAIGATNHIMATMSAMQALDEGVITPAQFDTLKAVLGDTSKGVPESTRRFNNQMASMLLANRDGVAIQTGRAATPVQEAAPAPAPTTPAPLPPALPDLPQQISDIVDGAPPPPRDQIPDASAASQTPATPGQSAGLFVFDPTKLQVDAQRFQFKEGGDQEGVTNRLKGVKRWDPAKANQVMVWQSKEGDLFVVDGHQRSGLARRLVEQGLEQKIELPGLLYRETDGFTPEKMRALAAGKNLAEGSGTLLDAAKVLKVDPTLIDESMPVSDYKIRQATDLAKLGDEPLRMVINEVTEPEYGAIVGRFIPDNTEQQIAAISALNKVGPANAVEAELIVRRVVNSQMVAAGDQAQGGLFGDELDMPESTVVEEIKIVAKAMAELKKDKAVFARVVKNADKIESVGSRINREASEGIVSESDRALILLASQSDTAGPVRTQLLELAKDLKQGKITSTAAARKLAQTIRSQPAFKTRGDDTIPDIAAMRARRRAPIDQGTMDLFAQGQEIAAAEAAQNVRRKAEQLTLEGMEQSARQLAAAREAGARGRMTSTREQANADQGLFAEKPDDGGFDFMKPSSIKAPLAGDRPVVVANMPKPVWDSLKRDIKKSQPLPDNFDNIEEVRASLASLQEELAQAVAEIAAELGINFKARSQVKTEKSILKKKALKNLESIRELTDLVGAGFQPIDMAQSDIIVERLSARFGVIDEGWIVTETGYFDRKIMLCFSNGIAGEIQMWPPGILEAKEDGMEFEGEFIIGHDLYEVIKETKNPETSRALYAKSVRFYSSIASGLSSSFQELFFNSFNASSGLVDAYADLNSASGISETLRGSSNQTAEGSTSTQAPDMAKRAALAFEPSFTKTVGSPSQDMNDVVATGPSNINTGASTTIDKQSTGNVNGLIPGQPGSATTQVATTGGSYSKAAALVSKLVPGANTILDYGAGMGLGTDAMRNTSGIQVDSYEPFPQRWQGSQPPTFTNSNEIRQTYDGVVSLNVLNVLEPKLRDMVAKDIVSKLAPGGVAVIGTRKFKGDVDQAKKAERADEPGAIWIKKGDQRVYQKGFDGDELVAYLKTIAPEGYTVERGSGIAANTAIVRAPEVDQMVARQAGVSLSGEPQRPAAGIPDTGGEQKKIALSAMSDNFVRLLNLTFRSGRMTRSRDALAQYNRKTGVIRARQRNDFSTLVHEGGHALHDGRSAEIDAMVQTHQTEMSQVALRHYGAPQNLNQAQLLREGFAEFFRFYVTNPQLARREAPKFFQDFDTFLKTSDPNLHKGLAALQSQVAYYTQQYPSTDVVKSFVKSAKQKNLWDPRDLTEVVAEESQNARPYEGKPTVGGFFDWLRRGFFDQTSRVYTAAVDQNNGMRKLTYALLNAAQRNNKTIDLKDADNPLELLAKASNSFMPAQLALQYGVRQYKTANPVGPGLRDGIAVMMGSSQGAAYFSMTEQRMADANAYLVALRAVEEYQRYAAGEIQNPPVGFTEADAKQAVRDFEAKYGQAFIDGARMVHRYARNLLDREFEAGLITQETYDLIKDKQNYVPLLRDMSDKNKEFGQNALTSGKTSLIKRFRGSSRDIIAPLDALMHRTFATEKRIAENDTIKALAALAEKAGAGAGALVEKIPAAEVERIQVQMNDVLSKILNDPSISPADAAIMDGIFQASFGGDETMSLFRSTMLNERGERILTYRDNGELRAIQLGDDGVGESVFNVMRGLGNDKVPLLLEVLSAPSRALRFGITRWPDFLLINYFRDQWNAGVATNVGYVPFLTGAKGMYDVVRRKKAFLDYSDAMGIMGGVAEYQVHKARVRQDIEGLKQKGYVVETFEFDGFNYRSLAGLVKGVFRLTELAEAGTRVGLFSKAYKRAIREGLTEYDAIQEASRIARDYMDFGRAGSKMAAANRLIPFLNANIQGLDVTIRKLGGGGATGRKALAFMDENRAAPRLQAFVKTITAVTENQRKDLKLSRVELNDLKNAQAMWVKMTGLALMSAAITYAFKDDEDYQETSEYLRQTGWIIPLGDGRIFYAPKPFEVALLGNFMERAIEYAYGDEAALDKFWNNFVNAVSPPMIPPIASQAFGLGANIDISFGKPREIVPSYMERLPPEQRYHATTTELAKKIGAAIDYPPAKIDFLITSLFGSMGRDVSGALDGLLNPERAEKGVDDSFITRRFIRDATRGGMASQDFTELSNRLNGSLTQASSGYKRFVDVGDAQGAARYLASLTQDERAWAVLDRDFDAKFKRLHPIYRAGQISTIVSGMRREILSAKLKDSDNEGEFILLTAKEKRLVDDFLTDYQRRERRNALISFEHPGWKNKKPIDTAPSLDLLREASPAVADELERRLGKAKVYDGGEVAANWPELRKRLLDEGSEAILSDLLP